MLQAGLFSAVASAFIIEINSELKPDPNEETAALLRVLIYKVDNTTFNNAPTVPQWTGPARMTIQVQAILYASLAISLFSAFLAMLGKQWLNRYASADLRGSIIDRFQHRQYKLNGIASWYFDNVIELLSVMLQAALLLFGCALSRYLWETSTTIASVVLGVTSFGLFLFVFIVIVGAVLPSCPYQTPGARLLRRLPHLPSAILSLFSPFFRDSQLRWALVHIRHLMMPCPAGKIIFPLFFTFYFPFMLAGGLVGLVIGLTCRLITCPIELYFRLSRALEEPQTVSDVNCISWTLRTSLDEPTRLSAMELLTTATIRNYNPTLIADCLDDLLRSVKVVDGSAVVVRELQQFARASAVCFLKTLSHLASVDPWSGVFEELRQPYIRAFPDATNFNNLPFPHILGIIHCIFYPVREERLLLPDAPLRVLHAKWHGTQPSRVQWEGYRPASDERKMVAYSLVNFSRLELLRTSPEKVSRWLLHFACHTLSQELMPATPVVVACLKIIWADLSEYYPHRMVKDERCVPYLINIHISDQGSAYRRRTSRAK